MRSLRISPWASREEEEAETLRADQVILRARRTVKLKELVDFGSERDHGE
jgi:hypothetical protein